MKKLVLRSLLLALLAGTTLGIGNSLLPIFSGRPGYRYNPPITQAEFQSFNSLTVAQMEAILKNREVPITRAYMVAAYFEDVYFWRKLAESSWLPISIVFLACIGLGCWERRDLRCASLD